MRQPNAYELTFSSPDRKDPDRVVVHSTEAAGPGGSPVYADDSGIVRAEISDQGEVRMLQSGGRQVITRPSDVKPLR